MDHEKTSWHADSLGSKENYQMVVKKMNIKKVYYHANCVDGLFSASLFANCLDVHPDNLVGLYHNSKEHTEAEIGEGIIYCDISPHPSRYDEVVENGKTIILDHHKSAAEIFHRLKEKNPDNLSKYSDAAGISGSSLTYEFVQKYWTPKYEKRFDASLIPTYVKAIGARDTFDKSDIGVFNMGSEMGEIIRILKTKLFTESGFEIFQNMCHAGFGEFLRKNYLEYISGFYDKNSYVLRKFCPTRKLDFIVEMFYVAEINVTSDLMDVIISRGHENAILVGVKSVIDEGVEKFICSMRSKKFNVRKCAESFGGGGHDLAAGFTISFQEVKRAFFNLDNGLENLSSLEMITWITSDFFKQELKNNEATT